MTPYLFWELLFLGIGVWCLALILVVYAWLLLRRQRRFTEEVMRYLERILSSQVKQTTSTEIESLMDLPPQIDIEKSIAISKDEPISKYADVTLSDSVNVSFVEGKHDSES